MEGLDSRIVVSFGLGGRNVAKRTEKAMFVIPIDPAQRCHFSAETLGQDRWRQMTSAL